MITLSWKIQTFTKKTRFRDFSYIEMTQNLNNILSKKNSKLETLVDIFQNLKTKI